MLRKGRFSVFFRSDTVWVFLSLFLFRLVVGRQMCFIGHTFVKSMLFLDSFSFVFVIQAGPSWRNSLSGMPLCRESPSFLGVTSWMSVQLRLLTREHSPFPSQETKLALAPSFSNKLILCCKYLTFHHNMPNKISIRFSGSSTPHGQIRPLLSRTF